MMDRSKIWRHQLLPVALFICIKLLVLLSMSSGFAAAQIVYRDSQNRTVAFTFDYTRTDPLPVILQGNSTLTNTLAGAFCLTPAGKDVGINANVVGRTLYNESIRFPDHRSFSTMFSFNTMRFLQYAPGHGFTFFLAPDDSNSSVSDSGGRFLGWLNPAMNGNLSGNNFAVEFDLVTDPEVRDPAGTHVGINVNSLVSNITATIANSSLPKGVDLASYSTDSMLYVWIDYDGVKKHIDLRIADVPRKPCNSLITGALDLTKVLLADMYVGFSSATGNFTNSQTTIFHWSFNATGQAPNIFQSDENCKDPKKTSVLAIVAIVVAILVSLTVVILLVVLAWLLRRNRGLEAVFSELDELDYGARHFSYRQLYEATKGFSAKEILGKGGCGTVYRGDLSRRSILSSSNDKLGFNKVPSRSVGKDDFTEVAVKKFDKKNNKGKDQGVKEYIAEVKVIGRLRHINLVRLLGWCHEQGELLLVYEYMPKGNLAELLYPKVPVSEGGEVLSWERRMSSLQGVAAALVFLHEKCEQQIIHRDVKSSNVMMDSDFNARLGDFGLARVYDRSNDDWSNTNIAGTFGYMDPVYVITGNVTCKGDVYSYGALALEVATGRKPHDPKIPGGQGLVNWVLELSNSGKLLEAADVNLGDKYDKDEMERVLKMGLSCCHPNPDDRPSMRQAESVLQDGQFSMSWKLPTRNWTSLSYIGVEDNSGLPHDTEKSMTDYGYSATKSSDIDHDSAAGLLPDSEVWIAMDALKKRHSIDSRLWGSR